MLTRVADAIRKLIPDVRFQIVRLAYVGVKNHTAWVYLEERPLVVAWPGYLGVRQVKADCSWFVRCLFWRAGAKDPMNLNYEGGDGNSETEWNFGRHILQKQIHKGDLVSFGPNGSTHIAVVVQVAADPVCIGFGSPGAPNIATVSEIVESINAFTDLPSEPVTYLRYDTRNRRLG
jgi:hypothetical protein